MEMMNPVVLFLWMGKENPFRSVMYPLKMFAGKLQIRLPCLFALETIASIGPKSP
jgi:hypothetical protein